MNTASQIMKFMKLALLSLLGVALSVEEDSSGKGANALSVENMASIFARSDLAHQDSMTRISRSLSLPRAAEVLRKSKMNSPALTQVVSMALSGKSKLRQPKGYSGVEGAKKLLNDMIFEAMTKYDEEIAKCTEYYSKQCAAMEVCRGQIAASNYIAANSRALILDSQATINRCEVDIPTRKYELVQHNLKCKAELYKLNTRLKIVMGDMLS
jgi:hypothetical protein